MAVLRGTRGRSPRTTRSRRAYSWSLNASIGDNLVGVGVSASFELATDLAVDERKAATVTRVRGEMVLKLNPRGALAEQCIWYAGIIVGHENLLTTLPDPEIDEADWMWYQTGYLVTQVRSNDAGTADLRDGDVRYITIDNRSQRKMLSEESVAIFVFKNDSSSDAAINMGFAARVLVKHR